MPWPWLSFSKQILIRSFKWGIVHPCRLRGCKNIRGQSWRLKKSARSARPQAHQTRIWLSWQFLIDLWLLTWFMLAQSTLISHHTEAFVQTEVGCTVSIAPKNTISNPKVLCLRRPWIKNKIYILFYFSLTVARPNKRKKTPMTKTVAMISCCPRKTPLIIFVGKKGN